MELSIIIVNHDDKTLKQAVDSISIPSTRYEIILVDNNSKFNPKQTLKRYKSIKFIENEENLGFAKANNRGIRKAKGKYVLLMNPDIILEKDTVKEMIAFMKRNRKVGIAGPKLLNKDRSLQHSCRRFPTRFSLLCKNTFLKHIFPGVVAKYLMKDYNHQIPRKVDWVSGALMLIRGDALKKAGLLDENFFMYFDDVDICRRIARYYDVAYNPKSRAIHLGGYASKRKIKFLLMHLKSAMHYFRKERGGKYG